MHNNNNNNNSSNTKNNTDIFKAHNVSNHNWCAALVRCGYAVGKVTCQTASESISSYRKVLHQKVRHSQKVKDILRNSVENCGQLFTW